MMSFPKPVKGGPRRPKPIRRGHPIGAQRAEVKAAGDLQPEQWEEIIRFFGGHCAYNCGRPGTQQDHVIPLSRGGKHTASNIVLACEPCNLRKGTQTWAVLTPHRFMAEALCSAA